MFLRFSFMSLLALMIAGISAAYASTTAPSSKAMDKQIKSLFKEQGFEVMSYKQYKKKKNVDRILVTNAPYTNVYGRKGRSDYLAISRKSGVKVRIEGLYQKPKHRTDYRVQNWYINAVDSFPERKHVLVMGHPEGEESLWKDAKSWLERSIKDKRFLTTAGKSNQNKSIQAIYLGELDGWVKKTFK